MPFWFEKYDPPPLSSIRERLLKSKLAQVDAYERDFSVALQESIERGLSPGLADVNRRELEVIRGLKANLRNGLETVRQQDAAETEAQRRLAERDPLDRARTRRGFYRTEQDRAAAIEGILQRERRQNAPLTREAWSRAKAIAASRRFYDPETSQLRGSRGSAYIPNARDIAQSGFDPCVDAKRVRREVMFAQRTAGRGYRGRHYARPC